MSLGRDLILGTAGHIDHGKTALVRALTGVNTDRLPAEKQRGITIDIGFAALDLGDFQLALIDVPGHERFIRNMLAGATGLDLALLVIAADDSVMPQTREHLDILRLLGLRAGVIALTKCDLVDPGWAALVEDEARSLVAGTFLEGAPIVRTSATTGRGLDELRAALRDVCGRLPAPRDVGLFRMAIDRSFTVAGHGTIVTGTVASGEVSVGDELAWHPGGRPVRVRGLHRHDRAVERIGRGGRAAINLAGAHHTEVKRGQELSTPGYLEASRALTVELRAVETAPRALRHRGRYRLHIGTTEIVATLSLLETSAPRPGETTLAQLFLSEPLTSEYGRPFVLREESPPATLGGGRVLQPSARRVRRRDAASIERLRRLSSDDPRERLAAALTFEGIRVPDDLRLSRLTGLSRVELAQAGAALEADGRVVALGSGKRPARLLAEVAADLEDRVIRALRRLHEARPRQSAIPRVYLAAELPDLDREGLVPPLLDRLAARRAIVVDKRTVALAGHEPKLSQGERRLKSELAAAIRAGGLSPPDAAELAKLAASRAAVVPELLEILRSEQQVVHVGGGLDIDFEAESELRRKVVERLADGATMTMSELRDLLGTTRKYAVPIGEYLDRVGVTVRAGDARRLGPCVPGDLPAAAPAVLVNNS